MRLFHLQLREGGDSNSPRRVEFRAADAYQAFQFALNERSSGEVELWDGEQLVVRMSKTDSNLWKLHGVPPAPGAAGPSVPPGAAAA